MNQPQRALLSLDDNDTRAELEAVALVEEFRERPATALFTHLARLIATLWRHHWQLAARITQLERTVMSQQDQLDADVAAINTALDGVQSEVDTLKAQAASSGSQLDFTALDAAVARATGMVPASGGDVPASGGDVPVGPVGPTDDGDDTGDTPTDPTA